jgi:D-glycero-D-manno-heptose 1,7-bisphosphate phosphatase
MTMLCADFTLITRRPAIFFDRDGILIQDLKYVNSKERTEIILEAVQSIKEARKYGFLVFVVTNQAGVARGLYTENECVEFNKWLMEEFALRGAPIDQLVYCPSHPDFSKKTHCSCRKPGTGMLVYLSDRWNLDISKSILFGDRESDVMSGHNFGMDSKVVKSGSELLLLVNQHVESAGYSSIVEVGKTNGR